MDSQTAANGEVIVHNLRQQLEAENLKGHLEPLRLRGTAYHAVRSGSTSKWYTQAWSMIVTSVSIGECHWVLLSEKKLSERLEESFRREDESRWERLKRQRGRLVHLDARSFLCPFINAMAFTILRNIGRRAFMTTPRSLSEGLAPFQGMRETPTGMEQHG